MITEFLARARRRCSRRLVLALVPNGCAGDRPIRPWMGRTVRVVEPGFPDGD
jgi:hypothetical protein